MALGASYGLENSINLGLFMGKLIRLGREVNALNCKQACWIV